MKKNNYPNIPPDKRYFTISEAAALTCSKPHILRYWEKESPLLARQVLRRGNRRYYSQKVITTLRNIHSLIAEKSYTIAGASRALKTDKNRQDNTRYINLRRELEQVIKIL